MPSQPITSSITNLPPGPPRLRLVDGNFSCSGFLELHKQGLWGAVASTPHIQPHLVTLICRELRCGTAGNSHGQPDPGIHLPVRWEAVDSCGSHSLLDCFNRTSSRGKTPAFIICSGENGPGASMISCSSGMPWGDSGARAGNQPHHSLPHGPHPPTPTLPLGGAKAKQEISVPGSAKSGSSEEEEPGRESGHGSIPNSRWQGPGCEHPAVGSSLSNFHASGMSLDIFPDTGISLLFHGPLPCYRHLPARASFPAMSNSQPQASPCPFP